MRRLLAVSSFPPTIGIKSVGTCLLASSRAPSQCLSPLRREEITSEEGSSFSKIKEREKADKKDVLRFVE